MEGEAPDKMDKSEIKESPAPPAAAMELSGPFSGAISIGGAAEAGRHENELDVRRGQVVELWARLKECDAKRKSYKEQAAATGGAPALLPTFTFQGSPVPLLGGSKLNARCGEREVPACHT